METPYNVCVLSVLCLFLVAVCDAESRYRETCRKRLMLKIIRPEGCFPRSLPMFGCHGTCISYTEVSRTNTSELTRHCTCCQSIGQNRIRTATFTCRRKNANTYHQILLQIAVPTECECRPCRDGLVASVGMTASKRSEDNEGTQFEGEIEERDVDQQDLTDIYMNEENYESQLIDGLKNNIDIKN
ncbi:unnamed protein product [Owenia fusiformis]|uniref:Uncharacterized protein n=1 Tax=Owenia fusiformis TaxID=6347 RepID=A0A8J1TVI2_OWEFU|nr:unnamed protein product [Owenia fusiformis]